MRSAAVLSLLSLSLVLGALAWQRPGRPPQTQDRLLADQQAIAKLQEQAIAANTAYDIDKLVALTTEDVVFLPPGRAPVVGQQALRRYYEALEGSGTAQVLAYKEDWQEVRIVGDYAFQWGTISERVKPSYSAPETAGAVHAMRVLQRQPDGSWKIARAIWNRVPAGSLPD